MCFSSVSCVCVCVCCGAPQVFNNSPDESTFYRFMLNREAVTPSLTMVSRPAAHLARPVVWRAAFGQRRRQTPMFSLTHVGARHATCNQIQPTLDAYTFNGPPVPVLLSASSLAVGDRILLLDTYFHVVIWRAERIAEWVKQGYQNDPQHEAFRQLLAAPLADAEALMKERFPVPRFVECDQHSSQERFLLATVDPGESASSAQYNASGQEQVFTEDVNLHVFMEHLKKLAVQ